MRSQLYCRRVGSKSKIRFVLLSSDSNQKCNSSVRPHFNISASYTNFLLRQINTNAKKAVSPPQVALVSFAVLTRSRPKRDIFLCLCLNNFRIFFYEIQACSALDISQFWHNNYDYAPERRTLSWTKIGLLFHILTCRHVCDCRT